mmetsp:Transcript_25727/g.41527  ORF Transcript_25727/g.41527 Transcript_25727/m.41527 type:complete len:1423 (+) Transcript_25727:3338-7606(+)
MLQWNMIAGDIVWYPHENDGFRSGVYVKSCEKQLAVITDKESGEAAKVEFDQLEIQTEGTFADMSCMSELNIATILNNLKTRFLADHVYTSIGPILIAVNPYRNIACDNNKQQGPGIAQLVEHIYTQVIEKRESHSCIVTGESGSGKTESVRLFVNQLATSSIQRTKMLEHNCSDNQYILQERIIQAGPLLESFGNARTVRNENSSRFAKWIEIDIEFESGKLLSGSISNYLLEKSRLVQLAPGERNFHIFYQLLTDSELCLKYGVDVQWKFRYLEGSAKGKRVDDAEAFRQLKVGMDTIGMDTAEKEYIYRSVCGVLLLGNVKFVSCGDHLIIDPNTRTLFNAACVNFCLDPDELETALTFRTISSLREVILKPRSLPEVRTNLDAFAKGIYHALFSWVTERINVSLDGIADEIESDSYGEFTPAGRLGCLDVFGFEIFPTNSFEQLCINYCNEKLQLYFNKLMFQEEIQLYNQEMIFSEQEMADFATGYTHNSIHNVVHLIEKVFFPLIDDELRVPNGSDTGLLLKLNKRQPSNPCYSASSNFRNNTGFRIKHFASDVQYDVQGFLAKSTDILPENLQTLCTLSKDPYLSSSFPTVSHVRAHKGKKTLGTQFRGELSYLSNLIFEESVPHFLRCIKPNDVTKGLVWNGSRVLEQVRSAGLLEVCKVRAHGFPVRYSLDEFCQLYGLGTAKGCQDASALCQELLQKQVLHPSLYRVGGTRIFFRDQQHHVLEQYRKSFISKAAVLVQKYVRGLAVRKGLEVYSLAAEQLERSLLGSCSCVEAIVSCLVHMETSAHHLNVSPPSALVARARSTIARVERKQRAEQNLATAISEQDWQLFCKSLEECAALDTDIAQLQKAEDILERNKRLKQALMELKVKVAATLCDPQAEFTEKRRCVIKRRIRLLGKCIHKVEQEHHDTVNSLHDPQLFFKKTIENAKEVLQSRSNHIAALIIQHFFTTVVRRVMRRIAKERMEQAELQLAKIAGINQLERLVKRIELFIGPQQSDVSGARIGTGSTPGVVVIDTREKPPPVCINVKKIASKKKRRQKRNPFRKPLRVLKQVPVQMRFTPVKKAHIRKDLEFLQQAIEKVKQLGISESHQVVLDAVGLARRLETLAGPVTEKRNGRGLKRMFSSGMIDIIPPIELVSTVSTSAKGEPLETAEIPPPPPPPQFRQIIRTASLTRMFSRRTMPPPPPKHHKTNKFHRTSSLSRMFSRRMIRVPKTSTEQALVDSGATSSKSFSSEEDYCSEDEPKVVEEGEDPIAVCANNKPKSFQELREMYGRPPPPHPKPDLSLPSMERAILSRLERQTEMVKVINSRCWESRRGLHIPVVKEQRPPSYIQDNQTKTESDYSFSSLYSNATELNEDCGSPRSQATIPEQHGPLKKRSHLDQKISRHSTRAYKQHWEAISFVHSHVLCTKTF